MSSHRSDRQNQVRPYTGLDRAESSLRTLLSCVGAPPNDPRRAAVSVAIDELLGSDPVTVHAALHRLTTESSRVTRLREHFRLTSRELEVAELLAVGKSNSEIASALSLSEHTCRHHTERVLAKLGVRSRAAVAATLSRMSALQDTGYEPQAPY